MITFQVLSLTRKLQRFLAVSILGSLALLVLSGCESTMPPETVPPLLVTLPVNTATPSPDPTAAQADATPLATPSPIPTSVGSLIASPVPTREGIAGLRPLWSLDEVARPADLAPTGNLLAVMLTDGRFVWLNPGSGGIEASSFLWTGILEGAVGGEVFATPDVALVLSTQQTRDTERDVTLTRARVALLDSSAVERWSLPVVEGQEGYSIHLIPDAAVVGEWSVGHRGNRLTAYEPLSGTRIWSVTPDVPTSYHQIAFDGERLIALIETAAGAGVIAYDAKTGEEVWRWQDEEGTVQPQHITASGRGVYVLGIEQILALTPVNGVMQWRVGFRAAPDAGLALVNGYLHVAPSPTADLGYRPGVIALDTTDGGLAWHSLNGLLADPVTAGGDVLWALLRDYDRGTIALSALNPVTGLEQVRLPISGRPNVPYRLLAADQRVYVLGERLQAYGY